MIADFVNRTGDPVFDGTLRLALSTKLEQSTLVRPMSSGTVQRELELMRLDPATAVTPEIAREICLRKGEKAMLEGSIAALGTSYAVNLNAIHCQTGDVLAASQVQADGKEGVLDALSTAVDEMRERLGEQLANTERPGVTTSYALTTASLEAYQSYARGHALFRQERRAEARPHFQRAHEIDPDFALAYWAQAVVTADPGERAALRTEAYQRRQSASMGERLIIEFDYVREVEGDLEKARQLGEETLQIAPNTPPVLNDLALLYRDLGDLRRATALHERFLQVSPGALSHSNLARDYYLQGRLREARDVLDRARALEWEHPSVPLLRVEIAYAEGDQARVEQELAALPAPVARTRLRMNYLQSRGRLREADALQSSSGLPSLPPGLAANAPAFFADCREPAASISGLCGEDAASAAEAAEALLAGPRFGSLSLSRTMAEAVAAALRGDMQQAADRLRPRAEMEFPDRLVSSFYAATQMRLNQPARAAEALRKITTNPAHSLSPVFPRAQVDLARALAAAGDTSGAKQAYEAFFEFWKDADEDIPLLLNARREYAALP